MNKSGRKLAAMTLGLSLVLSASGSAHALGWPDGTLERRLADRSLKVRVAAVKELPKQPAQARRALALRALEDEALEVRLAAAEVLLASRLGSRAESSPVGAGAPPVGAEAAAQKTDKLAATIAPWFIDPEVRVRVLACRLSARDPESATPLVRALGDAELPVRIAAAAALATLPSRADQPSLDPVLALSSRVDDSAPELRLAVIAALGELGDPRGITAIASRVRDTEAPVRRSVAAALGRFRDARASAALEPLLSDTVAEVRLAALRSLGALGVKGHHKLLLPLLLAGRGADRSAALAAIRAAPPSAELGRMVLSAATQVFAQQGEGDAEIAPWQSALLPHASTLRAELETAAQQGPPVALATLTLASLNHSHESREALACSITRQLAERRLSEMVAVEALGLVPGDCALSPLLVRLTHTSAPLRAVVRTALARYLEARPQGDSRAALPLRDALVGDSALAKGRLGAQRHDAKEALALIELLGQTRAGAAEEALRYELVGRDPARRTAAARALGQIERAPAALDALVAALADAEPRVRSAAALALGERGDAGTLERLERAWKASAKQGGTDTGLLLFAYGAITARAPSAPALRWLAARRRDALPEERDLVLAWLARAQLARGGAPERALHAALDVDWERAQPSDVRAALRGLSGQGAAQPLAQRMLASGDPSLRAEAAALSASLPGALDAAEAKLLLALAKGTDAAAVNAASALGRRSREGAPLCALLSSPRAEARAGALLGLARLGARCGDNRAPRALLQNDSSALVRRAAAHALRTDPASAAALGQCAERERDRSVAAACAGERAAVSTARDVIRVSIVHDDNGPRPHGAFVLEYADGFLRAGLADRQGALFDPAAPRGVLRFADHGEPPTQSASK